MPIDRSFLRNLRILGIVEGVSTLVLFGIAMPLKYVAGIPEAVTLVGSVHGALFIMLVCTFVVGMKRIPLTRGLVMAGVAGAVVPFGPFVVDRWLVAVGSESPGSATESDG